MHTKLAKTLLSAVLLVLAWCPLPTPAEPRDLALVLDNSGSMKKNDPEFLTGVAVRKFLGGLRGDNREAVQAESVALPTRPEDETGPAIPTDSDTAEKRFRSGADVRPMAPAAPPDTALTAAEDEADAIPPAAAADTTRQAEFVSPAPLAAMVAAGIVMVGLVAGIILLLRRRSAGKASPEDQFPKAFLSDLGGITQNPGYELGESLTVIGRIKGRDADRINYVVIREPTIGRRHALIEFRNRCFWVKDENSLNGTFVNDKRVEDETRLTHGDRIRFHKHEFEFLSLDMFETDRTRMGRTVFADLSGAVDGDDRTQPLTSADSK